MLAKRMTIEIPTPKRLHCEGFAMPLLTIDARRLTSM